MNDRKKKEHYQEGNIPEGLTRKDILEAVEALDSGIIHTFGKSTGYDVLHKGRRYPPKALIGLAAHRILGRALCPYDFKGGLNTKCFRILESAGFTIVSKDETDAFPDEIPADSPFVEGLGKKVVVNKYERDPRARKACIAHYGALCQVCGFDFQNQYGPLGEGFIHVHHITPLSSIKTEYTIDHIRDLRPVCPNCHAMLHRRATPFTLEELKSLLVDKANQP